VTRLPDDPVGEIDYERVVRAVKAKLSEKPSWGTRELYVFIVEAEVQSMMEPLPQDPNGHHKRPLTVA
jgi:hypothetical protein